MARDRRQHLAHHRNRLRPSWGFLAALALITSGPAMAGGTIKCESFTGECVTYDSKGVRTGTIDPDAAGGWAVRDTKGRTLQTIIPAPDSTRRDGLTLEEIIREEHEAEGLAR